jgi:hypothetical protein
MEGGGGTDGKRRRRAKTANSKAASKVARAERRKKSRNAREPHERPPTKKDWTPKRLPTEIQPLRDSATAFTAKKVGALQGALQEAEVWTLNKLLENEFEFFEWDGMYEFFFVGA